jgi:uncharacterized membrane protein YdbT with pleckstrin-like domain
MKDDPLRTVQPVVVPAQLYTWGTVASGFSALFPASFTMAITERLRPSIGLGIVTYLIFFALFLSLITWNVYSGTGVTTYRIYRDRIESEEGLVNRRHRTVLIGWIIDVQLTEGVLQQTRGAGTITLVLRPLVAQGGQGTMAHQIILLSNIPQPREVYDLIRSLALGRKVTEEGNLD